MHECVVARISLRTRFRQYDGRKRRTARTVILHVMSLDMGDVPTWINAVTTLGALVAAGVVVKVELGREARARAESESAQADLVAAWMARRPQAWVVVRNSSTLPIYGVTILLKNAFRPLDPEQPHQELRFSRFFEVLPPGEEPASDLVNASGQPMRDPDPELKAFLVVEVWFTDAAGRRWVRRSTGNLERVTGNYDFPH